MRIEGATRRPPEKRSDGNRSARTEELEACSGGGRRPENVHFVYNHRANLLCEIREATDYHEPAQLSEAQRLLKSGLRFSFNAVIPSSPSPPPNTRPIPSPPTPPATSTTPP